MIFYTKHEGGYWYRLKYVKYSNEQVLKEIIKKRHLVEDFSYVSILSCDTITHPAWMTILGGKLVHAVGFVRDKKFMRIWDASIGDFRKLGQAESDEIELTEDIYRMILNKKDE